MQTRARYCKYNKFFKHHEVRDQLSQGNFAKTHVGSSYGKYTISRFKPTKPTHGKVVQITLMNITINH